MNRLLTAMVFLLGSVSLLGGAQAQEASDVETTTETYGDWTLVCIEATPRACRMVQRLDVENEEGGGRLLEVTMLRNQQGVLIALELPFGLDLRAGVVIQFDENDEITLPFSTCYPSGCQVIALLAPEHLAQFRAGTVMRVGFRGMGQQETLVAEVSLNGSSMALAELPEPIVPSDAGS
ncbi:MAG: invasion associated locus B family protein [Gammaproteobacteria bacterium]|nr:invasion associated locus B family protein [Gammaproteobacteria bacterium]